MVGYLRLHTSRSLQDIGCDAELEIFVRPRNRGQGIGKSLLRKAEKHAADETKVSRLTLIVLNDNIRARLLYEKCGFRFEDTVRSPRSGDGVRMAKDIKR